MKDYHQNLLKLDNKIICWFKTKFLKTSFNLFLKQTSFCNLSLSLSLIAFEKCSEIVTCQFSVANAANGFRLFGVSLHVLHQIPSKSDSIKHFEIANTTYTKL
jgi:hypothetical protein